VLTQTDDSRGEQRQLWFSVC